MNVHNFSILVILELIFASSDFEGCGLRITNVLLHFLDLFSWERVVNCLPESGITGIGIDCLFASFFVLNQSWATIKVSIMYSLAILACWK